MLLVVLAILIICYGIFCFLNEHFIWGALVVIFGCWVGWGQHDEPTLQQQKQRCEQAGFFWEETGEVVTEDGEYVADGKCVRDIP